jgi:hypothetical protein
MPVEASAEEPFYVPTCFQRLHRSNRVSESGGGSDAVHVAVLTRKLSALLGQHHVLKLTHGRWSALSLRPMRGALLAVRRAWGFSRRKTFCLRACQEHKLGSLKKVCECLQSLPVEALEQVLLPVLDSEKVTCQELHSHASAVSALLNQSNSLDQTGLMVACSQGFTDMASFLIAQGADPWLKDRCGGLTALHYAARSGQTRCVHLLMSTLPHSALVRNGSR